MTTLKKLHNLGIILSVRFNNLLYFFHFNKIIYLCRYIISNKLTLNLSFFLDH